MSWEEHLLLFKRFWYVAAGKWTRDHRFLGADWPTVAGIKYSEMELANLNVNIQNIYTGPKFWPISKDYVRKHKIVKKSEHSDNKTGVYSSFKLPKMFFRKKSLCKFFWSKNGKYPTQIRVFNFTTVDYAVYRTLKITLSSIGFEWNKSVDLLVSDFFLCCDLSVIMFSPKGKRSRFPPV